MAISLLSTVSCSALLIAGLSLAAPSQQHHPHHHKHHEGRQLSPVEQRIKNHVEYFLEEGYKTPYSFDTPLKPHLDTPHCEEPRYNGEGCCLQDEIVDMEHLNIGTINRKTIEPRSFVAFTCTGNCKKRNPLVDDKASVDGECRPATYTSLLLDYEDEEGETEARMVPQTLVRSCSCH